MAADGTNMAADGTKMHLSTTSTNHHLLLYVFNLSLAGRKLLDRAHAHFMPYGHQHTCAFWLQNL